MNILTVGDVFLRIHKAKRARADIWFIHGFGESGLSYREAFSSRLAEEFNLFVPDFPGFGVSPYRSDCSSIEDACRLAERLVSELSGTQPIAVVCHSLGGIIGTRLSRRLESRVTGCVSIEGNLTLADAFFSGLAAKAESTESFYESFEKKIREMMSNDETLRRYYASLRFHDPRILMSWGKTGVEATGDHRSGDEFAALPCRKIYFWGDKSTAVSSQEFIKKHSIPNKCFKGSGHWPMIERPEECYGAILDFLSERS